MTEWLTHPDFGKMLTLAILRRNPTALGQRVRFPAPTHQKRTHELGEGVLCVRISPLLPVPGRIHEEQAIVWRQDLGS